MGIVVYYTEWDAHDFIVFLFGAASNHFNSETVRVGGMNLSSHGNAFSVSQLNRR